MYREPVEALAKEWRHHRREVRRLHEKLFYRPLLSAVARLSTEEARLSPEAARVRLAALGFRDPAGAMRHLEALTEGVSRRATIQRHLLPDGKWQSRGRKIDPSAIERTALMTIEGEFERKRRRSYRFRRGTLIFTSRSGNGYPPARKTGL